MFSDLNIFQKVCIMALELYFPYFGKIKAAIKKWLNNYLTCENELTIGPLSIISGEALYWLNYID